MSSMPLARAENSSEISGFQCLLYRPLFHVLLIAILAGICYGNTFQVPFIFDDLEHIRDNGAVHGLANYFRHGSNPNRFICFFTFALNYQLGGMNVTGYHLANLLIHIANGLLVYSLVHLVFLTPYFRSREPGGKEQGTASLMALFAALLFVVHPVQTQAVTYIYQRLASLATMFYLLAVVLYVWGRLQAEAGKAGAWAWQSVLLIAGSVLAAMLAMKTKEFSVTLPFVVLLFEVFFFRGAWRDRLLFLLPVLLTIPIVPMGIYLTGESAGEVLSDVNEKFRVQTDFSRSHYLFTQFRVIVTYLRLLILPVNQNLDYDYPVYTTLVTPPVFLSFLLLTALFSLAVYLFVRSGFLRPSALSPQPPSSRPFDPSLRLVSFGLFWFFMSLSVESSVIPIADVIFEHRLYLPMVGAVLACVAAFFVLFKRFFPGARAAVPVLLAALIIVGFGSATFLRNQVWGDSITLWRDTVMKSPAKVRPYNNLGASLNDAGRQEDAMVVLAQAVSIKPDHPESWYNLGRSYLLAGRTAEAVPSLERALRLKPDYGDAYANLAAALNQERRFQETVTLLEQNLNWLGERAEVRFNLGVAYAFLGNLGFARKELAAVYRLDPTLAPQLADLLERAGR